MLNLGFEINIISAVNKVSLTLLKMRQKGGGVGGAGAVGGRPWLASLLVRSRRV